ncbi:MAG: MerR family DNA-binding transcriptional regulator [Candidatus Competibacterales bacterium]|nr:MerR family DNA-binding transcriptional regulator [Candidatus Competibacterales bacterium]
MHASPSSERSKPSRFSISDLAREFDVTTRAIRFYEDRGLLAPRREGRRRIYSRRDRTRLRLTLRGKRLGFSLDEIREILDLFDSPMGEEVQLRHFLTVLNRHRTVLEQQKADIEAVLDEIDSARKDCLQRLSRVDDASLSS